MQWSHNLNKIYINKKTYQINIKMIYKWLKQWIKIFKQNINKYNWKIKKYRKHYK
jgi:hypothetical protein